MGGHSPALRPALDFHLLVLVYAAADFGAVAVMDTPVLTYASINLRGEAAYKLRYRLSAYRHHRSAYPSKSAFSWHAKRTPQL